MLLLREGIFMEKRSKEFAEQLQGRYGRDLQGDLLLLTDQEDTDADPAHFYR